MDKTLDLDELKPGDRIAVWFYITDINEHDVFLANKPGRPAIVDAPVSDILTLIAAARPAVVSDEVVGAPYDWTDAEDDIADAISDSIDMDWSSRDGARAVVAYLKQIGAKLP